MSDLIYIYHNNQQEGPYSSAQLQDIIAKAAATPHTLAWKEGMSEWAPLDTILPSLKASPAAASLPPPSVTQPIEPQPGVAPPPVAATVPSGVGGWLLLFCVLHTILAPLGTLGQMPTNWAMAQPAFAQFPDLKTAIMWENAGLIALLIYGFIVGFMIWSGSPNGREIAKKFLVIRLLGLTGIEFITVVLMADLPAQVLAPLISKATAGVVANLLVSLVWWFYFKKSKRVRNTYGAN